MNNRQIAITILSIIIVIAISVNHKFNRRATFNDISLNDLNTKILNKNSLNSKNSYQDNYKVQVNNREHNTNSNVTSLKNQKTKLNSNEIDYTTKLNSSNNVANENYNLIGGIRPETKNNQASNHNINGLITTSINESNSNSGKLSGTIMYVSEFKKNQISACQIANGNLTNCKLALSGLNGPENLLIVKSKLYILSMENELTSCDLDQLGDIINCNNSNSIAIDSPAYIAYSNESLYITNFGFKEFSVCSLDNLGNINQCNRNNMNNLNIFTNKEYDNYIYSLINESSLNEIWITKCGNGITKACQFESNSLTNYVYDYTFNSGYIYITNENITTNNNTMVSCSINPNGDMTNCKIINNNLAMPTGMVQYTIN